MTKEREPFVYVPGQDAWRPLWQDRWEISTREMEMLLANTAEDILSLVRGVLHRAREDHH